MSDLEARLRKGSRDDVKAVFEEIQTKMRAFSKNGNKYQFKYGYAALRSVCVAIEAPNAQNIDLYCDIVEDAIFPNMNPCESCEAYWDSFLGVLRFLLNVLGKKDIRYHNRCYNLIKAKHYRLRNKADYTYFLEMHMQHLYFQKRQAQSACKDSQIMAGVESLTDLFEQMNALHQNKNVDFPDLIIVLNKAMLGKRNLSNAKFLNSLPTQEANKMFASLFRLLILRSLPKGQLEKYSQEYLNAFIVFLLVDTNDSNQKQQLALQHLRCCREVFKEEMTFDYYYQLLYYWLKLAYKRNKTPEFRQTYLEICKKFTNYFERNLEAHLKDQCYTDFLVATETFFAELHYCSSNFDVFWEQMAGDVELYSAHFSFISCCVKSSSVITQCQFGAACVRAQCTSLRKHVILSLGTSTITAYTTFLQQQKPLGNEAGASDLNRSCLHILRYTISVIDTMQCIDVDSSEFLFLLRRFIMLGENVRTSAQATFYIQLVNLLPKIRPIISPTNWKILMRRVYKAASLCDQNFATTMHCVYISSMLDHAMPVNQIIVFYQNTKGVEKCISEVLSECESPLLMELTSTQKRRLYSQELMIALHYFKQNFAVLKSLLRCSQTPHDYIMLARHLKSDKEVSQTLKEMLEKHRAKLRKGKQITRLDQLVYAYICTKQMVEMLEEQKIEIDIVDMNELNLEECLGKKNIVRIDGEMKVLKMATEALNGFQAFYDNADVEPLGDEVEVFVDWESITDDVAQIANTLQLMGYITEASEAWLLLHRITSLLDDRFKYLRAVSFFFAHCQLFATDSRIDLHKELEKTQRILMEVIPQLTQDNRILSRHRTFVLFCLCYLANFYACTGRWRYANALLAQVERLQNELKDRQGKFDIILLTMYTVRFRLIWQHRTAKTTVRPTTNVLRLMDMILENFRNFASFSSVDQNLCLLHVIDFVQCCIECSANRIGDRISLVNTVLNLTLQSGLALRTIQVQTALLLLNLQMENVEKAQANLRIIEYLFCCESTGCQKVKNLKPLKITSSNECYNAVDALVSLHTPSMFVEPIRKQSVVQLTEQLKHLDIAEKTPITKLETYLKARGDSKHLHGCPQLEWTFFVVGCLSARLHFLTKDFDQLSEFYAHAEHWLQKRSTQKFLRDYFKSMQLANTAFQINYLRVAKAHEQADAQLSMLLENLENFKYVDINYRCNLSLQRQALIEERKSTPIKATNLRRALTFNDSPEEQTITTVQPTNKRDESSNNNTKSRSLLKVATTQASQVHKVMAQITLDEFSPTSSSDGSGADLNACQIIEITDSDANDDSDDVVCKPASRKQEISAPKTSKVKTNSTRQTRKPLNVNTDNVVLPKSSSAKSRKVTSRTAIKTVEALPVTKSQKTTTRNKTTKASSSTEKLEETPALRKTRTQLRRLANECKENIELK